MDGEDACTLGRVYVVVVQLVLLYGLETWLITYRIGRVLGGFHYRVVCRMTGRQPWRVRDDKWVYTALEGAIEEAILQ